MYKVYIMPGHGCNPKVILESHAKQTPGCSGKWKDIEATLNIKEADFFVVLDKTSAPIPDVKRTFFFGLEPKFFRSGYQDFSQYSEAAGRFHYDTGRSIPFNWWTPKTYDELSAMEPPKKEKRLSCIVSDKRFLPGHKLRLTFIKEFCEKYAEKLDLFGKVSSLGEFSKFAKGSLPALSKDSGLEPYEFSFSFENGMEKNFYTEKLTDPMLFWTVPFYWGCPNVSEIFPDNSYLWVGLEDLSQADEVARLVGSLNYNDFIEPLREARDLILNEYNFWEMIRKAITSGKIF